MTPHPGRVFVVDDDEAVRAGLARLLRAVGYETETFASAHEFLARPPYDGAGCVILDLQMPGTSGLQLQDRMLALGIDLPVLFLTAHADVPSGVGAMKKGAIDFLEKPVDEEVLTVTVREALRRHADGRRRSQGRRQAEQRLRRLSAREREVMEHVIRGRLNKQIASDLGIAEKTVKVHRGRVMEKMEVRSVAELVHLCDSAGIEPASR